MSSFHPLCVCLVSLGIKDIFSVPGYPTTWGSGALANRTIQEVGTRCLPALRPPWGGVHTATAGWAALSIAPGSQQPAPSFISRLSYEGINRQHYPRAHSCPPAAHTLPRAGVLGVRGADPRRGGPRGQASDRCVRVPQGWGCASAAAPASQPILRVPCFV
jgi:hypothetical protein